MISDARKSTTIGWQVVILARLLWCFYMNNVVRGLMHTCGLLVAACLSFSPSLAATDSTKVDNTLEGAKTVGMKVAANEKSTGMTREQMIVQLRAANEVAKESRKFGHHPFGAVLVGPDNQRIIMHQGNINIMRHAEVELSRRASEAYSPEYLANCTLVTTFEPCVMCSGNIYFANIGNVVYGATEETLKKLTGTSKVNPTMHLPCKQVFDAGQKSIQVSGPFPELEAELIETHKGFWN